MNKVLTMADAIALIIEAGDTEDIKVKHPGILDIPAGKKFYQMPLKHYIDLARRKGKAAIMRGLSNLARWNKSKAPDLASKARDIIDKLKGNGEWEAIGAKAENKINDPLYTDLAEKLFIVRSLQGQKELSEAEKAFIAQVEAIELNDEDREIVLEKMLDIMEDAEDGSWETKHVAEAGGAKVQMGKGDDINSGFQGYMPKGTTYAQLVKVFGQPQRKEEDSGDGKVKREWIGTIDGNVFTIYDYKSDVAPEQNTDWHIGGKKASIAGIVASYFRSKVKVAGQTNDGPSKEELRAEIRDFSKHITSDELSHKLDVTVEAAELIRNAIMALVEENDNW